jgi:hypothetical protein
MPCPSRLETWQRVLIENVLRALSFGFDYRPRTWFFVVANETIVFHTTQFRWAHATNRLKSKENEWLDCCFFSCFSVSQIRVFSSRWSVGRKNAKIWDYAECAERQLLSQL